MKQLKHVHANGCHLIKIELDNPQLEISREIAKLRHTKRRHVSSTRNDGTKYCWEDHYIGVKGEIAVADLLGVEMDPLKDLNPNGGDGHEPDLWYRGKGVEVKTSSKYVPRLIVQRISIFKADWFILCRSVKEDFAPGFRWVTVYGAISKERYKEEYTEGSHMNVKLKCIDPEQLTPMREWM